jgi:hypothetical protein
VIVRLALRSLRIRPVRTAVLACGFGLGIAVMAELLGIGEVILDQARSPALQGGGDLVVAGAFGSIDNARYVLSTVLRSPELRPRIAAASPSRRAPLYLIGPGGPLAVVAQGGIPSLEKAVGDPEVQGQSAWTDRAADRRWVNPDADDVLRAIDRFHRQPDVPEFASSWAEWLYFNGRSVDGRVRFYLTFLVGPVVERGQRSAGVRLQLDTDGRVANYSSSARVDGSDVLAGAPDLVIGASRIRLEGQRYRIDLRLAEERTGRALTGELTLDATPGRSLPPAVIRGARGWLSGYVVPVLSGTLNGTLVRGRETISLVGATGYHDHNWGFWRDVRWQWGQVAGADVSLIYGRVIPPAGVADADRVPGFLGVLGPAGLIGSATNVAISERDESESGPRTIRVVARGSAIDVELSMSVDRTERTELAMIGGETDFLQLGGLYRVTGRAGGRTLDFSARGAAETFRRH